MFIYAADVGNGFSKRSWEVLENGRVIKHKRVEPSVFSSPKSNFWQKTKNLVEVYDEELYLGTDALNSGHLLRSALGDSDFSRYESKEFKQLVWGFMAKDLQTEKEIDVLVMGLPVTHFRSKREALISQFMDQVMVVKIEGRPIVLKVKKVQVLPQPLGTYFYLDAFKNLENLEESRILIVDGGYGTLDITEMKGLEITDVWGRNLGMKKAYGKINSFLQEEFEGYDYGINMVPHVLQEGFTYGGKRVDIENLPQIQGILRDHFENVYDALVDKYGSLKGFDYVIWTGGMAMAHLSRIQEKEKKEGNFILLEEGQLANVMGYHAFGKTLLG